jgi:hypothetical protein
MTEIEALCYKRRIKFGHYLLVVLAFLKSMYLCINKNTYMHIGKYCLKEQNKDPQNNLSKRSLVIISLLVDSVIHLSQLSYWPLLLSQW